MTVTMQIITFISYLAVAAAATDVITARVYNQKNLKGSHEDVHGYGCGNVGSSKFKVNSIHLRRRRRTAKVLAFMYQETLTICTWTL
ncbi:hypothetical protein FGLOB1_4095 [Fusarium globosum]|uniref:Uncharacterized protein n=1 Tax=Fusarium globosum TaxID=78864 RepID=A0A8H5YJL6_9HYPO|nr:hypothetical protein FGLOB1_4095 [Fusarium globosum]